VSPRVVKNSPALARRGSRTRSWPQLDGHSWDGPTFAELYAGGLCSGRAADHGECSPCTPEADCKSTRLHNARSSNPLPIRACVGILGEWCRRGTNANFDFGIATESGRPYIHYLENADKLAGHLVSFADGVDLSVGDSLEEEITAFAATYLPRKTDGGPLPGIGQLMASCDALSSHLAVYRGRDAAPLPAARADTVRAKALAAQKRIQKVQAARRAAAGAWPSCRGVPLGTRDTQCSTEDF
jgi:hypothetical protein